MPTFRSEGKLAVRLERRLLRTVKVPVWVSPPLDKKGTSNVAVPMPSPPVIL